MVVILRLKNVDLWQALKAILEISGFGYQKEEGIIWVGKLEKLVEKKPPLELEKRRFQLNYIDTTKKEEKALLEDVLNKTRILKMRFFRSRRIIRGRKLQKTR
ncbi:MAG: STN domain-containing protein [Candidatus Bathyarchaeota archaeon]|nr:STN domain-containing protein [Candidatus Bathyarchaeota archaeon]